MNTETGEIKNFTQEQLQQLLNPEKWTEVDVKEITDKQKKEMQVSKFDNKSKLGKLFTHHRKLTRSQRNRKKHEQRISPKYL
jgi:hypothetical protein